MAHIAARKAKRFQQPGNQTTFAYAQDSDATTLLIIMETPSGVLSQSIDLHQTQELAKFLREQIEEGRGKVEEP